MIGTIKKKETKEINARNEEIKPTIEGLETKPSRYTDQIVSIKENPKKERNKVIAKANIPENITPF